MRFFAPKSVYKIAGVNILIAGGLLAGPPARAQESAAPTPPTPADPALQARIEALEQKTAALQQSLGRAEAEASAPRSTTTFQTDEGGFAVTSADRQYQVRFKGLLQIDGRRIFGDEALGNSVDTFLVRRARPILAGTVFGLTDFYLSPDFGNSSVVVIDAYLDTHPFPWLRFRAGKFKGPVGLERLQADQDVTFIERALDSNLSSQREVGLELWGDLAGGLARYEAGVFNGNPDNGINDIDSDHAKSFAGRIFLQPFDTDGLRAFGRLGLGIAASTGNEKGSATNSWLGNFKSPSQSTIFSYLTAPAAATVWSQGRHTRVNPQLYYYLGPFGLLAEWVREHQGLANAAGTAALNNSAGHVTASFVVGGDASYEGVKPHHALDVASGGLGALEIGLRYHWLDVDGAAFPTAADPTKSVNRARGAGLALNWQLSRNLKAGADFDETRFEGGAQGTASRHTEKVGIGRFQLAF